MAWYEKIDEISDSLIKLDQKLGIKRIMQYLAILLLFIGLINIKSVLKWGIETVSELSSELHAEKLEKRDQLLVELIPELHELLGATGADRVLYLEYHNSKENVVGIPFKYIDLVLQSTRYGVPHAPSGSFKDVNIGDLSLLYESLKVNNIITCQTSEVEEFRRRFPGNYEYLNSVDGSKQHVYVTIPGIRQPIGMIILEWMDEDDTIDIKRVYKETTTIVSSINGTILRYM